MTVIRGDDFINTLHDAGLLPPLTSAVVIRADCDGGPTVVEYHTLMTDEFIKALEIKT